MGVGIKGKRGAAMASGFKINKQGIAKMAREIEKEFAKHPVRVPLHADGDGLVLPGSTVNYNGPVVTVNGDHAQLAWGNGTVNQAQRTEIAPGFEDLAQTITAILASLPNLGLSAGDQVEVQSEAETVLGEVVKSDPDAGIVRRSITMIKGLLAPVAAGLGVAVSAETAEAAKMAIEALGNSIT